MTDQPQRKYGFTGEKKLFGDRILRRIYRLSDGLIGGWIEKEKNLSHEGDCFVYEEAWAYGNACVQDNAMASGHTRIAGSAVLRDRALATGRTYIIGKAMIRDRAVVRDRAWVGDEGCVCDDACIEDDAGVSDHAIVGGVSVIGGEVWVRGTSQVYSNTSLNKNERLINVIVPDQLNQREE